MSPFLRPFPTLGRPIAVRHRQDPGWGTGATNDGVWQGPAGLDPGETDRLTSHIYANDSDGRLVTLIAPEGRLTYEYDEVTGRHTRTTASHDDGNGGQSITTDVSYDHDRLGRLVQVAATKLNGNTVSSTTDYAYFASGQLARQDTDGVISNWGYDPLGRLLRLRTASSAGQLALFTYGLDKAGHRLRINETIDPDPTTASDEFTRTADYQYDNLYRLTKETVTDVLAGSTKAFEQSYTFDLAGNRLRKIIAAVGGSSLPSGWTAGTTTSTYNARDQLLSTVAGAATTKYGYDANGSLTTRKNGSGTLLYRQGPEV